MLAIAAVLVAAALAMAACGGTSTPRVASLHNAGHGGVRGADTATTLPKGNPTVLVDEWASCMRAHGDPGQADPVIDSNNDININWNSAVAGGIWGTNKGGQGNSGPGQYCRQYLNAAQTALGGNQQQSQPSQAAMEKFSACMRANGIPDFPDPKADGSLTFNVGAGGDLTPSSPTFQSAWKICSQRTGVHMPGFGGGSTPPGIIKLDGQAPPGSGGGAGAGGLGG